ncbi:MAG: hypothetical protein KAS32_26000 [Candidatus Peribacteraceae bacterium]|nr:hypothetical protein [Candidatus Peribacteraceae bacterium]
MKVKYIGEKKRINSYGTFEPGKEYSVSEKVGMDLLTCPLMFVSDDVPAPKTAEKTIVEVDGDPRVEVYMKMTGKELAALCLSRGIEVKRGSRKDILAAALVKYDDANVTDDENTTVDTEEDDVAVGLAALTEDNEPEDFDQYEAEIRELCEEQKVDHGEYEQWKEAYFVAKAIKESMEDME